MPISILDDAALANELSRNIQGEVRFDNGSRALYATDASNYRQVPIGVVIPKTVDDVIAAVAACNRYGAPIVSRGGGTSLAGQCCNVAVVMDMSKYLNRILALDPDKKTARVEPGCVLDDLRDAAEKHHLTFAPDPSTHTHNTLGGMIGNNSCGVHSVMGGKTVDNVIELDVLLYDGARLKVGQTDIKEFERIVAEGGRRGEIYARLKALCDQQADRIRSSYPRIPRRVSGYNLDELLPENGFNVARALVGTEGTCVVILEATLRLVDSPPSRSLLVLGYPDVFSAGDHVPEVLKHKPIGLEGIDDRLVADMKAINLHPEDIQLLPDGGGWLLAEFGGKDKKESDALATACMEALKQAGNPPTMKLFDDPKQEKMIWKVRESGLGATAHVPNKKITWEGWEDAAVPPDKVGDYLRDFRKLLEQFDYACDLYGHFGEGCIHTRIDFDLETNDGIHNFHLFLNQAANLVVRYGGSLSGEHGDGQSKAEFLPLMFGDELVQAFREFKSIWDPDGKMNPGKIVDAYLPTENLRLGTDYKPIQPATHFQYPKDKGRFSRVILRCVGIGNCRQHHSQTMCPSYKVTREEQHSTRGRARLLFETMRGEVIKDFWQSEEMKEALNLCLACKGCKGDCPVNVDMATYKAEFLSHYYQRKRRPREAYAFGWINRWAMLASYAPGAVNWLAKTPGFSDLMKSVSGMAPQRNIPQFAPETFRHWFRQRTPQNQDKPPVILWPDTFNNHFHPETAIAAVEVLEAAGFQVRLPNRHICCGRPLYDFGMLDRAKHQLQQILSDLRPAIDSGIPVVGLEPACIAVFRDELVNLFPNDEAAQKLSRQTYFFSEFLLKKAPDFKFPKLERKAILHGHCHQKAIIKTDDEQIVLRKLGLDCQWLDSGCCGMAGSFGFEKDKYEVSKQIGELVLLPAVRAAPPDALIVADGYSCREQIAQMTGQHSLHSAEVIRMALQENQQG
ncbi:FAD/FMN-containing dehydrogenase [Candidatus Methylobacter favarea]|uniref:FAD/FMN-containing dehydrogenase n=1 Tax=Candidatus Methylobacter favarea TaxID=2707345 RepID=A0A8S0XVN4_9GAMM|nr:FAD-binding and (Fe-S)-binding domain-containing protein [Candidatus Methylobacter favarea]CAA9892788.1 FAD/FMN-containing dehydrogenase [Candidatus Methylobacter favarea]